MTEVPLQPRPRGSSWSAFADHDDRNGKRSSLFDQLVDEVALADLDAEMAQDVVGGGHVEEEVRQREVEEVGAALEGGGLVPERDRHVTAGGALELRRLQGG